jgi:glycosyltransferase involved in cell wall biosynthesis
MNRARVLCVPSVKASNGMEDSLPLVVLEAQAMGLPVVAFDSGGLSEETIAGETALLAPERDVPALAHHLETVFTDHALWDRLHASGPTFVRERFNLRRQTAELETLYDRVRSQPAVTAA